MTHDYKGHGTTTLFAALDVATGSPGTRAFTFVFVWTAAVQQILKKLNKANNTLATLH